MKMPSNAPSSVKGDTVGPPDKVSNIRPYKFHQPQDETETERKYREQRTEALEFNHDFWYKHNKSFFTVSRWSANFLNVTSYMYSRLSEYRTPLVAGILFGFLRCSVAE